MGAGTPLGRVRGLGSAHEGVEHWWHQKLTAGTNIFVMSWLLISIARLPGYDRASVVAWMSSAWVAVPMALLIISICYHFRLGLQVVIEDYVHDKALRTGALLANTLLTWAFGLSGVFAVAKIAFTA